MTGLLVLLAHLSPTLGKHYRPGADSDHSPSWPTFIGRGKDSLWSSDLFRCESIPLKIHWVLVVMDPFTRRSIVTHGISIVAACSSRQMPLE